MFDWFRKRREREVRSEKRYQEALDACETVEDVFGALVEKLDKVQRQAHEAAKRIPSDRPTPPPTVFHARGSSPSGF